MNRRSIFSSLYILLLRSVLARSGLGIPKPHRLKYAHRRVGSFSIIAVLLLAACIILPVSGAAQELGRGLYPRSKPEAFPSEKYLRLTFKVMEAETERPLKGILLDVYRLRDRYSRELVLTRSFYSGHFEINIDRSRPHVVIVKKRGYEGKEYYLDPAEMGDKTGHELWFYLEEQIMAGMDPFAGVVEDEVKNSSFYSDGKAAVDKKLFMAPSLADPAAARQMEPKAAFIKFHLRSQTELYAGPSAAAPVRSRFAAGDRVDLLETTNRHWWKVRFKGQVGWVKADFLRE